MAVATQQRPMIAARMTGPGPAKYMLPTTFGALGHDFTRLMAPAYTFGDKLVSTLWKSTRVSPGPIYFVDSKFTRFGKDGTPEYSMLARPHDLDSFKTPGPGTYNNEKCPPTTQKNPPIYSMASRTRYRLYDSNPAPNRYTLPPMLGSNVIGRESYPSYSMTSRSMRGAFDEDLAKTPGSAAYKTVDPNNYMDCAPIYTMLERRFMPGDKTQKPGPGAHYPEKVRLHKPIPPEWTMGIRHSEFLMPLITEVDADDFYGE